MAKRITNLELRGRSWYYRVSFTLNRKTFGLRLSLETADPVVARERASRMDLALKRRWREMVASPIPMTEDDKQSIMRAAALDARRSLERIEGDSLATAYESPDEGQYDLLRSLRGLQLVVRDMCLHGLHRGFGTREYEMHLLDGMDGIGPEDLGRLREVIDGGDELAAGFGERASEALRQRNVDLTPSNLAFASRQIAKGTLLALREAIARAADPAAALDSMLAALEMPSASGGNDVARGDGKAPARSSDPWVAHSISLGDAVPKEPESAPLDATSEGRRPTPTGIGAMRIREAADAFLSAHPRYDDDSVLSVWTAKTRSQFEAAVFLAGKFFDRTTVARIDEMAMAEFVRTLRRLPANHHKTPVHAPLSLAEIAERGRSRGQTLGIATINRHVRFLKLVLEWAWKRTSPAPQVDWSAFIATDRRMKRDARPAFTQHELETLFAGAVWTGSESRVRRTRPGSHVIWDAPYWVPILLAFTGARREEVSKLAVADVEQMEGIWAMRIRVNAGGRLKNAAAVRDLPLADAVISLGFLDFVERQKAAGQTFLFPELRREAGGMGDVFYKRWWRAYERAGLVPDGKDIHSIRHYVSTSLAAVDVSEERRADLLGHTLSGETAGRYTKRTPLPLLRDIVNLLPLVTRGIARGS